MTTDWLDDSDGSAGRAEQLNQALEFAQLYLVFEQAPQAKELLRQWDKVFLHRATPIGATLDHYGADEGVRAFIRGIHMQIEFAKQQKAV